MISLKSRASVPAALREELRQGCGCNGLLSNRFVLRWLRFMRRIEQVRATDWFVRTLVVGTFFAYFVAPSRWMFLLGSVCSGAVGVWALLYPEGVLGWVKTAHPSLDVN